MTHYSDKLKDPRWQKKRLEILQRDNWACQRCFDPDSTLIVHHRYYLRDTEPWDYYDDALVTLCQACHDSEHETIDQDYAHLRHALSRAGAFGENAQNLAIAFVHCPLLTEYEWSIIESHLSLLIESKVVDGDMWKTVVSEAVRRWKVVACVT